MSVIHNQLRDYLSHIDTSKTIYIAFSGGIDSTVLLHAVNAVCNITRHRLRAIHINHQIHRDALLWAQHCAQQCQRINVALETVNVNLEPYRQQGVEGAARTARYQAFENHLTQNDILFTAHHADDQLETVLLQLFRGAGVHGLAACASQRALGSALLMRPLLQVSRAQIEHYAQQQQLQWLEDPSNLLSVHDRNYLRHKVMPLLHTRWHNLPDIAGRVASWQSEAAGLLDQLADSDLEPALDSQSRLDIAAVQALEYARKKNLLRRWIRRQQCHVPSADILARIVYEVMHSREDAQACVQWQSYVVRRYRNKLYLLNNECQHDASHCVEWQIDQALELPALNLTLTRQALLDYGVKLTAIDQLSVRFRQGGEAMRPRGRGCQKELKALFQEAAVEPWLRERIPLIFYREQLIFVWGYWIQEGY